MENLIKRLQEQGLTTTQSEIILLVVEDWLNDYYPMLARLYQTEILRKEFKQSNTQFKLVPFHTKIAPVLSEEVNRWRELSSKAS